MSVIVLVSVFYFSLSFILSNQLTLLNRSLFGTLISILRYSSTQILFNLIVTYSKVRYAYYVIARIQTVNELTVFISPIVHLLLVLGTPILSAFVTLQRYIFLWFVA